MFKISFRDFRYQDKIISASIDLIIEDKILIFDEEYDLSDSCRNLFKTIQKDYEEDKPIFLCSCGNSSCNSFNFFVKHNEKFITISNFKKAGAIVSFESFTITFDEYLKEIVNLCNEIIIFEENLKRMISDATFLRYFEKRIDLKKEIEKIKEKFPDVFQEERINFNLNIEEALEKIDLISVARTSKEFPWKIEEIINCLYHQKEYVRYKSAEILGIIKEEMAIEHLIEKLVDESPAVRYISLRSLSRYGYFKNIEFMNELFLRRKWERGCRKKEFLSEKIKYTNSFLPLIYLLKEKDGKIRNRVFKILKSLDLSKEKEIPKFLLELIREKNEEKNFKSNLIELLSKTNFLKELPIITEIIEDKDEEKETRKSLLTLLNNSKTLEVIDALREIRDRTEFKKEAEEILSKTETETRYPVEKVIILSIILFLIFIFFLFQIFNAPLFLKILLVLGIILFVYFFRGLLF